MITLKIRLELIREDRGLRTEEYCDGLIGFEMARNEHRESSRDYAECETHVLVVSEDNREMENDATSYGQIS